MSATSQPSLEGNDTPVESSTPIGAQQVAATTAPPAALGQGKDAEEAAADGLDEDQEEQESAGIYPLVREENDGFAVLATILGIPLCSPYPSEGQVRRRNEEEAESAQQTAAAIVDEAEEGAQDEDEWEDDEDDQRRPPLAESPQLYPATLRKVRKGISILGGTSDLNPAVSAYPPEEQARRQEADKSAEDGAK